MKKQLAAVMVLAGMIAGLPAPAQEVAPVPRLVCFAPLEENGVAAAAFLDNLPEVLYTSLAARHELIRVKTPQEADSVIRAVLAESGTPGEYTVTILLDGQENEPPLRERFREEAFDAQAFRRFVDRAAGQLIPLLPPVDPQIRLSQVIREQKLEKAIDTIDFAERLARPFQLTLWGGGLSRSPTVGDHRMCEERLSPYPLLAELGWYPNPSFGLLLSFYMRNDDFPSIFSYKDGGDGQRIPLRTRNLMLLPGLGFSYRTLGRVAAQFAMLMYAGAVRVTALEPVTDPDFFLQAGEQAWLPGPYVVGCIRPSLEINLTPTLSAKTALSMYIRNYFVISYFQLGLGVRW